jgi:autophagy-related protein 17
MALLLESLVSHFDLCANAVKHTEGGFAAIKRAASDNLLPDGVTISGVMADPDTSASHDLAPMSEDERTEMLTILLSDAPQVLDVVQELNARLISMEESSLLITNHLNDLRAAYASTTTAFNTLESIASRLPSYINASTVYLSRWESFKSLLEEQTLELDNMRVFYEGYFTSYDGLILEVSRRRQVEDKMKHILRKAMEQVQRLADADRKEREGFRRDVGDFLPADLWEGLTSEAPRWAVVLDGVEGEGGGEEGEREVMETPELGKKVVEDANKREMERRRL